MHHITEYGRVSYYKLNVTKTQALSINLPATQLVNLKSSFPLDWREDHLTFLGTKMTKNPMSLFKTNYQPLLETFKSLLSSWEGKYLSWVGRIAAIKMSLLPKLQYLYRTLQIPVPDKYIKALTKMLTHFTWQNKKPRVATNLLQRSINQGGLGFPDLKAYCKAATLMLVPQFLQHPTAPQWLEIENSWAHPTTLHSILWTPKSHRTDTSHLLPTTQYTLHVWDSTKHLMTRYHPLPLAAPTSTLAHIIPNLNTQPWLQMGIQEIGQLYNDKGLKLFPDLQQEFQLPHRLGFAYLQIKSYLAKNKPNGPAATATKPMTEFEQICTRRKPLKKLISISYKALTQASDQGKETHIQSWHRELGSTIPLTDWTKAYSSYKGVTSCATHIEMQRKLLYRWYLKDYKQNRHKPRNQSLTPPPPPPPKFSPPIPTPHLPSILPTCFPESTMLDNETYKASGHWWPKCWYAAMKVVTAAVEDREISWLGLLEFWYTGHFLLDPKKLMVKTHSLWQPLVPAHLQDNVTTKLSRNMDVQ
ncbi:Hypothetical predicted protein [Pelobates cultripes]|uniref:Reverse transcriptase n=1 Tax=Pelobates cultripes TaxID=61616 RepID=A0AAD1R4W1_PELCU|nr:Hypothetical predicted protein [Pelobates cultripes]